ncbi:KRAB-A domain-containing protein 2-like [Achroia grisella]|uniref:KRAB-A domain-containing protein 2-like n=1 Tax=Achroia grisella TaxID=688607 RepID=UPI0027D2E3D0|nr:KRAB-A domain-containing protein 2-like [Achroia grisella]
MATTKCQLFDYEIMRASYVAEIMNRNKKKGKTFDRASLEKIINSITMKEKLDPSLASVYEVIMENGKNILIMRRPTDRLTNIIKLIALEDTFDILVDIHRITGHSISNMKKLINLHYEIPSFCVTIFMAEFKKHNSAITSSLNTNNRHVLVQIIDMSDKPDGIFTGILLYHNQITDFIVLKPITNKFANDMAMELLNIFLDFGTPEKLLCVKRYIHFFMDVIELLKEVCSEFNNLVIDIVQSESKFTKSIISSLEMWIKTSESFNWSIACHLLQWKFNTVINNNGTSPYMNTFRSKPNLAIVINHERSEILDQTETMLHTEEDLGISVKEEDEEISDDDILQLDDNILNKKSERTVIDHVEISHTIKLEKNRIQMLTMNELPLNLHDVSHDSDSFGVTSTLEPMPSTSKEVNW